MERVGGYDTRFKTSQDLDLWLRLGEVGKLANVAETVLQFRLHESSVSETKREQQRQMGRLACEEAWQRRGLTGMTYEADEPWRPGSDRASKHRFAMQYGWWAWQSGQRKTALHYGAKAIAAMPLQAEGWKLVRCAVRTSPPPGDHCVGRNRRSRPNAHRLRHHARLQRRAVRRRDDRVGAGADVRRLRVPRHRRRLHRPLQDDPGRLRPPRPARARREPAAQRGQRDVERRPRAGERAAGCPDGRRRPVRPRAVRTAGGGAERRPGARRGRLLGRGDRRGRPPPGRLHDAAHARGDRDAPTCAATRRSTTRR